MRRGSECSVATFTLEEDQHQSTVLTFECKLEKERLAITAIVIKEEEASIRCGLLRWRRADLLPLLLGNLSIECCIACTIPQDMLQCSMLHFICVCII